MFYLWFTNLHSHVKAHVCMYLYRWFCILLDHGSFFVILYLVKPNFARLLLHGLKPDIITDVGYSLQPDVDIGQIQGAFIQRATFIINPIMYHNSNSQM